VARFDTAQVRQYYDRHTSTFVAFGRGGSVGAIHRPVWGPGVQAREQAFHYVDDRIAELIRHMPAGDGPLHVVDLGCGVGASLCYLAALLPIRGTGVTLSPVQARLAQERVRQSGLSARVACVEASFDDLPPDIPPADVAYAIESFAHAVDPARFFAECGRLVKPGGALVICDDFRRVVAGRRAERTVDRFTRGWHLNSLLAPEHVRELATAAGFTPESRTDLSPFLERPTFRDRVVDAALGWLPLDRTPLGPVLGGTALRTCVANGWTGYELCVFTRLS
jgi:SAM-dependent methyltransferase